MIIYLFIYILSGTLTVFKTTVVNYNSRPHVINFKLVFTGIVVRVVDSHFRSAIFKISIRP